MNTASDIVDVAVGVLRNESGQFLLGKRAVIPGRPYPGHWEFPGGKREPGESIEKTLIRELKEETDIDIDITQAFRWITRTVAYPHITVRLHFYQVRQWQGQLKRLEHSEFRWFNPSDTIKEPVLLANLPILKFLRLPEYCAITQAHTLGTSIMLKKIESALQNGLKMIRIREPALPDKERFSFASAVKTLCDQYGAIAVLNISTLNELDVAQLSGFSAVHLSAAVSQQLDDCPCFDWVGASCHNMAEIQHAEALGVDYVQLSPVKHTKSHPDVLPMGWGRFSMMAGHVSIPVVALGGLTADDLPTARAHGGHGIACLRATWR